MSAIREAIPRTPELEGQLLALLRAGVPLAHAAPRLFISSALVYKWARADAEFAARLKAARPAKLVYEQKKRRLTTAEKERARRGLCLDRDCGACKSCKHRAISREVIAAGRWRKGEQYDAWTADDDALVRTLAGLCSAREIAARLTDRATGPRYARSTGAVRTRASKLGVSLDRAASVLSAREVTRFLGATERTILPYLRDGSLRGVEVRCLHRTEWRIARADFERFLRAYPWLYDPARLPKGRLGDLGRLIHRADPWLTQEQAAAWLGVSIHAFRWHGQRGHMPRRQRAFGAGGQRPWVIRRNDLPRISMALGRAS